MKMTATCFKQLLWLTVILLFSAQAFAASFNQDGEFTVFVDDVSKEVYNDNIETFFTFTITNNIDVQSFEIILNQESGWDIDLDENKFLLNKGESKDLRIDFIANSNFDYSPTVVSPDQVVISQNKDYVGEFDFPITIIGEQENVSVNFAVDIKKREILPVSFTPKLSTQGVSPVSPLRYTISAENVEDPISVEIKITLGNTVLAEVSDFFEVDNNFKIYSHDIPSQIDPGVYNTNVVVRVLQGDGKSAQEWFDTQSISVVEYENLIASERQGHTLFGTTNKVTIVNEGNVMSSYKQTVPVNFFNRMFFSSNADYQKVNGGVAFSIDLNKGESTELKYSFNYLSLYLVLLIVVIVLIYILIRKSSNPLDIETKLYDIKKVMHEGVKSVKVRIGFENQRDEEIDTLKVIFRMPTYLKVKDNSFLLSPPKQALKGRDQYKLVWEFKRFSKQDSRILGFTLVNNRGILGDVKLPPLEIEVKINGKVKKYYQSFPIIRG